VAYQQIVLFFWQQGTAKTQWRYVAEFLAQKSRIKAAF